jgi:hypothetical protein
MVTPPAVQTVILSTTQSKLFQDKRNAMNLPVAAPFWWHIAGRHVMMTAFKPIREENSGI